MRLMDIVIVIIVLAVAFIGWRLMTLGSKQTQKRIERMKARSLPTRAAGKDMSLRRKTAELKGLAYWLTKPLPDSKRLEALLLRAGKTTSSKAFLFRQGSIALGIVVFFSLILGKSILLSLALAVIFAAWLPLKLMQFSIGKKNKQFLRVFPDAIDLIVRGLRSGLPVSESFVLVSTEVPEPVASTFATLCNTMKLGVPMEKALVEMSQRLGMTEFNFFTTSIILQRETGGNLAEILNNLSEVLRNRFLMRMKIRALSSEARASAYIIGALPFVVVLAVSATSPGYMVPLWDDPRGHKAVMLAVGMMFTGGYIMYRMTKFEI